MIKARGRAACGSPPSCNITPTRALCSASACQGSVWSTRTDPESGRCKPVAISIEVDLPAPLGPSTQVTWPAAAPQEEPMSACTDPNVRETLANSTASSTGVADGGVDEGGVDVGTQTRYVRGRREQCLGMPTLEYMCK